MSEEAVQTTRADEPALSQRQIMTVLVGLLMGLFLGALDQTIVSSAIRVIADELHGQTAQAWITTAYLITSTISTPLYGKLSDIYGRKPLYLTAISLFLAGSLLCGLAGSIYQLAAFRAVQGLGAGGLMSLGLTIVSDMVPPRERGRYQGYFMAVFGIASVIGPVIGGLFAGMDTFLGVDGWRWVFLVNLPFGLVAVAVVAKVLNVVSERVQHRVDYLGAAALVVTLVPLLTVAEQGREWGWGSTLSLTMYGIGALGLVLFLLAERRMGAEALLPLRLFRLPSFRLGNTLNFLVGIGMFGGLTTVPLYLQIVKGLDPTQAGLMLLPMSLGIGSTSGMVGKVVARTGRLKPFPIIGTALMAVSLFLLSRIGVDSSLVTLGLITFVMGAGLGMLMQTLTLVVQTDASQGDLGVATGSVNLFRQTGGTVGAATLLSILFSTVGDNIGTAMRAAASSPEFLAALKDPAVRNDPVTRPYLEAVRDGQPMDLNDTSFLHHLDPRLAHPVLEGFADSMSTVFITGGCVMVVAFALTWLLRNVRLD
ncbi:MDR family MFS transporter [Saccharopolyspora hordei]|uniref:EmrB/QacA subfamily drug resistance transporter n=1 Tax=Saccharopolyspora hordei TaxID=1838 RepID=A0A853ANT2_9PSEU|nr:MDR family MFS transporter [Saccharopolyspora hordei]NYI81727.1 EmrB/QacA subfamily drug resistance transporter [Saccharopolyspora hordei]